MTKNRSFVLSDESLNTQGYRMLTSGADLEQFKKNPVMLYIHDDWELPIGRWENIRKEGDKILADPVFDLEDEKAKKIAGKVERGFIKMASIGAWPLEFSEDPSVMLPGQTWPTITKWRVREASIVPIGSNHNAVRLYDHEDNPTELIKLYDSRQITSNNNCHTMKKELAKALNLADNVGDEELHRVALAKVNELASQNETLKGENVALADKVRKLTDAETARKKAEAIALVDAAIKDGRINADSKEKMLSLFDADHESAKAVLDSMPKRTAIAPRIKPPDSTGKVENRDDWTYMEWAKKDPRGLKVMKLNDPDRFKELIDNYKKSKQK